MSQNRLSGMCMRRRKEQQHNKLCKSVSAPTWFPQGTERWWPGSWRCGGSGGGGWRCWFQGTWWAHPPGRGHSAWQPGPPRTAPVVLRGHLEVKRGQRLNRLEFAVPIPPLTWSTISQQQGGRTTNYKTGRNSMRSGFEVRFNSVVTGQTCGAHDKWVEERRNCESLWALGVRLKAQSLRLLHLEGLWPNFPDIYQQRLFGAVKICSAEIHILRENVVGLLHFNF